MDYLKIASKKLRSAIRDLQKVSDIEELDNIINNLKHEEDRIDTIIMNREDNK